MDKLEYIKKTKNFLRKVVKQRKMLLKHDKSKLPYDFTKRELANIDYALPKLVRYDQIKDYIERKNAEIRYLIPGGNNKWIVEFDELLNMQFD